MKSSNHPNERNKPVQYEFRILFRKDERYYFQLDEIEGESVLFSRRGYSTERGCQKGIESLLRIMGTEDRYELEKNKKGRFFFTIKSGNHQEMARSVMFDSEKEARKKMIQLMEAGENIPVFGVDEKASKREDRQGRESVQQSRALSKVDNTENMPRYKFSVIYYPDSKIWMLKNDFSGHSKKLKSCNGSLIQEFLIENLPAEERETTKETAGAPPVGDPTDLASKPSGPVFEGIRLDILTSEGQQVVRSAKTGKLEEVEVALLDERSGETPFYQGQVIAKSLEDNKRVVVGKVSKQKIKEGRFVIPILGANYLKPGLYLLMANVSRDGKGKKARQFYGSRLVELN